MFPSREQVLEADQKSIKPEIVSFPHIILVRSIWNQIQGSIPEDLTSFSSVDAKFSVKLSKADVLVLMRFVESKSDISTEAVNEILSRFLVPVPVKHDRDFKFSYNYLLFLLPIVIFFFYRKFGIILSTLIVILCIAAYEVYVKGIAKRHALISRLPSIPEHCLPYSQQSIITLILGRLPFSYFRDDCVKYFEIQMTPLFADLRPDRIIYLVLNDFMENVFSTAGASIGRFYNSLNSYAPFFIATPFTILFIYCLPSLIRKASGSGTRKHKKRRLLDKSKPVLTFKQG